jgi:hypothetical protein
MKRLTLLIAGALWAATAAQADDNERDPTAWPPALRQALAASRAASQAGGESVPGPAPIQQIIRRDGRAFVVVAGRPYGVGELLDGARIQKIDEQSVWLLEGGRVRRETLFSGVEKRSPAAEAGAKKTKEKP